MYMNYNFIDCHTRVNCHETFTYTDKTKMIVALSHKGISSDIDLDSIYLKDVSFFYLDRSNLYPSMIAVGKKISHLLSNCAGDICVNLVNIPVGLKMAFCQRVMKHCYTYYEAVNFKEHKHFKDIIFRDIPKFKGSILDLIHQASCADLTRRIENSRDDDTPLKFCQKIKSVFTKKKFINIHIYDNKQANKITNNNFINDDNARFMILEIERDIRLPTICLIGESVMMQNNQYKSGGAVVSGILNYYTRFGKKDKCNIVAILPVIDYLDTSDSHASSHKMIQNTIEFTQITYKPRYIISFASAPHVITDVQHQTMVCYSSNEGLLDRIVHIGKDVGENISVSRNRNVLLFNTQNVIHFNIVNDITHDVFHGNGVCLGIKLVKNLMNNRKVRNSKNKN